MEKPALLRSRVLWLLYMLSEESDDKHFNMGSYIRHRAMDVTATRLQSTEGWKWCETACCIAGHIVMLGGVDRSYRNNDTGFKMPALRWLGFDPERDPHRSWDHFGTAFFVPGMNMEVITLEQGAEVVRHLHDTGVLHWKRVVPGVLAGQSGLVYDDVLWYEDSNRGPLSDPLRVRSRGDEWPVEWQHEGGALQVLYEEWERQNRSCGGDTAAVERAILLAIGAVD